MLRDTQCSQGTDHGRHDRCRRLSWSPARCCSSSSNPPFSDNGAWVIIDIATGQAQVCLFFDTSGCIPGATEAVVVDGAFSLVPPADYHL